MNFKKIVTALLALCIIAGTPVVYSADYSNNTAYADNVITMGSITLDNEHPSAVPTLTGIDASKLSWYTSDKNVAVVDENGKVTAVGKGTCIISAYYREQDTSYYIDVTSNYEPAEQGMTEVIMSDIMLTNSASAQQIVFTVPSGTVITYSSTDENIAVVDDNGLVTAKGMGKCQIFADIKNTRHIFNVTSVYTGADTGAIDIGSLDLTAESSMQTITISGVPQDTSIKWSSSDESIAVVSSGGVVSGIKKGSCIVYAEIDGRKYAMNINVDFNIEDIMQTFEINEIGSILKLSYTSMTDDVVFSSSDESVAVVDSNGTVTAKSIGETVIKAESTGGTIWVRVKVVSGTGNSEVIRIGDANCDENVNMGDVVSIIQHIGNRDEYCLSEQGMLNAELCDGVKGVTGMDAVTIQMLLASMIDSFAQS